jgi:hypothetical protein
VKKGEQNWGPRQVFGRVNETAGIQWRVDRHAATFFVPTSGAVALTGGEVYVGYLLVPQNLRAAFLVWSVWPSAHGETAFSLGEHGEDGWYAFGHKAWSEDVRSPSARMASRCQRAARALALLGEKLGSEGLEVFFRLGRWLEDEEITDEAA